MDRPRPQKYQAVIEKKEQLRPFLYMVTFRLTVPTEITFLAGQTFLLNVSPGVNRSMSIASAPSDKNTILMCHDVSPGGPGSQWTIAHGVGDTATFMAPLGMFTLDRESRRKKIFVATGTGIAPYHAMLLDYLPTTGADAITLYWGMRHEEDLYWMSEFEAMEKNYPNFRFILCLSQPSDTWQETENRLKGRVTAHVVRREEKISECDIYLCGNQKMIKDMEVQLAEKQVPPHHIFKELYF
jgi:NAD(P)H-flavin reductase